MPSLVLAQFSIVSVNPGQNDLNVTPASPVEIVFSDDLDASSLNNLTLLVHGNQTGFYQGGLSYTAGTRTARFVPATSYKEGETISVVLTSGLRNSSGQALLPAYQFSFAVAVEFGTGIFDERIEISIGLDTENPVERDPSAIYAGDLDNDGYVDLAVVNNTTNSVSILSNQFSTITGSFQVTGTIPVGNGPNAIAGADFDRDGLLDLAVTNFDDNSISVLRNVGAGNFVLAQTVSTSEHPTYIEFRDFNNDGQLDLAITALGVNRLQIFRNQAGSFSNAVSNQSSGASPYGFTSGDFDNDGDADIVVSNSGDNTIIVYKNDGTAQFTNSGEIAVPDFPTLVQAGDLLGRETNAYGDGFLDLAIVHPNINAISVLDNRSRDGDFEVAQQLDVGLRPSGLFVGDVDTSDTDAISAGFGKDHDLDLAVPNIFSNDAYILRNQFNNDFAGSSFDVYAAGETPVSITGADFDRDGDVDLAVTNLNAHGVSILLNNGGRAGGIRFTQPPDGIDFGQVYIGRDSTQTFTLFNPTDITITLDEITNILPVFVSSESQAVIGPGEFFDFSITFAPADTVTYIDTLIVRSNAFVPTGELRVGMRGEGIISIIEVIPDTLNFGPVQPPQVAVLPIEIFNRGNGALNISEFRFTDPAFSAPASALTVEPYSSQVLDITFRPQIATAYLDTLLIFNSDSLNSPLSVLLLGGPNTGPPSFTSPDTVDAYEDSLFTYTATVSDPDSTQPVFVFQNLPGWLALSDPNNPANNSVTGTPLEGYPDTTFRIVAIDGIFSDTLDVYVRVIPVNDPPEFLPVAEQTTTELMLLTFNVMATDPEDSTLVLSALNLPAGAVFSDNGNKTGIFSWVPPAGSRGVYSVTFVATEAFEQIPLSDTLVVTINVLQALPDLNVTSLSVATTDISIGQTHAITGSVRLDNASIAEPFRLTFLHDSQVVRDTLINSLSFGEVINFTYQATFNRLGNHEIRFEADSNDQISESDESNNSAVILLKATKPSLIVRPNPFTPNADGFNDEALFDFSDLVVTTPELKIFSFNGHLLTTLTAVSGSVLAWNGRDSSNREMKPGMYLYVFTDNQKRVASGYLVLAR